jgi:cytochrome c
MCTKKRQLTLSHSVDIALKEKPMSSKPQDEAKAWVDKALAFYNASGRRIALAEFNNPKGQFVQDEFYIFVLSPGGTMLAHGVNEKFVGEEFSNLRDSDGKFFIKEILDIANKEGSGWLDYKWYNPVTKQVLPKIVYFEKLEDLIICGGVYGDPKKVLAKWQEYVGTSTS